MSTQCTVGTPDDWPSSFPEIKDMDNLMRCPICYEYIETAMLAPVCSHTYCSLCIKRYIGYKTQCPQCWKVVSEPELINNRVLDDLIKKFVAVRSKLLSALTCGSGVTNGSSTKTPTPATNGKTNFQSDQTVENTQSDHRAKSPDYTVSNVTGKNLNISSPLRRQSDSRSSGFFEASLSGRKLSTPSQSAKKLLTPSQSEKKRSASGGILKYCRKKSEFNVETIIEEDFTQKSREHKWTLRDRKDVNYKFDSDSASESKSVYDCEVVCIDSDDELDATNGSSNPTKTTNKIDQNTSTDLSSSLSKILSCTEIQTQLESNGTMRRQSVGEQPGTSGGGDSLVKSEKVPCPVCGVAIAERHINLHLDRCLNPERTRASTTPKRKSMPKLVYYLMSDKELKKRVADTGLPTQGDRKTLEWRHREFTLLHNASCDSTNPKPIHEIIKELERSEKVKALETKSQQTLPQVKGASEQEVAHARDSYVKVHKLQFKELIEQTKRRMKDKRKNATKAAESTTVSEAPKEEAQNDKVLTKNTNNSDPKSEHNGEKPTDNSGCSSLDISDEVEKTVGHIDDRLGSEDLENNGATRDEILTNKCVDKSDVPTADSNDKVVSEVDKGILLHVTNTSVMTETEPLQSDEELMSSPLFESDCASPLKNNLPLCDNNMDKLNDEAVNNVDASDNLVLPHLTIDTCQSTTHVEEDKEGSSNMELRPQFDLLTSFCGSPDENEICDDGGNSLGLSGDQPSATASERSEIGKLTQVARGHNLEESCSVQSETGILEPLESPVFSGSVNKRLRSQEMSDSTGEQENGPPSVKRRKRHSSKTVAVDDLTPQPSARNKGTGDGVSARDRSAEVAPAENNAAVVGVAEIPIVGGNYKGPKGGGKINLVGYDISSAESSDEVCAKKTLNVDSIENNTKGQDYELGHVAICEPKDNSLNLAENAKQDVIDEPNSMKRSSQTANSPQNGSKSSLENRKSLRIRSSQESKQNTSIDNSNHSGVSPRQTRRSLRTRKR